MGSERKDRIKKKEYAADSDIMWADNQKKSEKSHFIKRFFDWIAKGAEESKGHGAFCAT